MAYNRWLAHHGVKDQKWGVKNGPPYPLDRSISDGHRLIKSDGSPQSKKRKPVPPNTTYIKNHKGPMYFISEKELDGKTLEPRIVDNYFTKNGYEDNKTKRISFAPDVGKCLSGLSQNVKGKQFNVYVPDVEDGIDVYKPNSKAVPDAEITQEMWVTEPVKVKKLGSVTCTGDTGEDGHKFKYGDKTAELYDWNYKWDQNTVFVSGSSKTQDETSGYYRKELPKDIQKQLDSHMSKGNRIIVGDAPGIDRQVQDYLNAKKYKNVEVYGPGKQVRYSANSKWKTNPIDDPDHEPGSKEWLAKKDIAMTEAADEGLAIVLDEGAKATRKNVQRLSDSGKSVKVYSLNRDGSDSWEDDWDRDTYSQKGLSESQNTVNPNPQKKSISNRINSFMDRVFGNSIKAQEKGQQKVSVNYEPVTSEKAKTKRGETYEINDWNGDAQDTIKAFKSNPEPHINVARKAALQEARRIIGWYAKDNPEAQRFLNMSDQQLSKRIGLDFVSAYSHGTVEFSFGDAGTGDFLGHEVDVEYDLNRRKVMNVSVNG